MWSQSTNVTDRRTDGRKDGQTDRQTDTICDRNTALCTKVHRAVEKSLPYLGYTNLAALALSVFLSDKNLSLWNANDDDYADVDKRTQALEGIAVKLVQKYSRCMWTQLVTGTFVPTYFRSQERKYDRWNFRSMVFPSLEHSLPGTFVRWNFRFPGPNIRVKS